MAKNHQSTVITWWCVMRTGFAAFILPSLSLVVKKDWSFLGERSLVQNSYSGKYWDSSWCRNRIGNGKHGFRSANRYQTAYTWLMSRAFQRWPIWSGCFTLFNLHLLYMMPYKSTPYTTLENEDVIGKIVVSLTLFRCNIAVKLPEITPVLAPVGAVFLP